MSAAVLGVIRQRNGLNMLFYFLLGGNFEALKEYHIEPRKEGSILSRIKRRKANWFGYILRRNCFLKQVI